MKTQLTILTTFFCLSLFSQQKGVSPIDKGQNGETGQTYAVVIGISDYQDEGIPDLRFAARDAEVFANYLKSPSGGSLDDNHLKILLNEQATQAQFAAALDWLWEVAQENDRAIIYFSGHGDVEKKSLTQPGFLLCWDAPARVYMAGGAFPLSMLQEVISTISVQNKAKVLMVADACRAGKLSGNSVGGAQITGGNLARQYANEIKILSCQPNEYSIEGEQWGGGRGAFSYHLLDGLYGLADKNDDQSVSLMEIGRYLEDMVSTEVAPQSQIPMIIGSRIEKIASVHPEMLSKIQEEKKGQLQLFNATASRGIEKEVLAKADSSILKMYNAFQQSIHDKRFLEPVNDCTDFYYNRLSKEPQLAPLHSSMLRNYVAALQDDAQQVMNTMLKSGLTEQVLKQAKTADIYKNYPAYLERAANLLGKEHYMYQALQARKHFYEGQIAKGLKDKRVAYQRALDLEPDMAHSMVEMIRSADAALLDSATYFFQQSTALIPSWVEPYLAMGDFYRQQLEQPDKEEEMLNLAEAVDSSSVIVWYKKGGMYYRKKDYNSAEKWLLMTIEKVGSDICFPCAYLNLGNVYESSHQYEKAEEYYKKAIQADSSFTSAYDNLGHFYAATHQYKEAEKYYKKAIQIDSTFINAYQNIGRLYLSTRRYGEAEKYLKKAILIDSTKADVYNSLGRTYLSTRQYEEAEKHFKKAIQLDSTYAYAHNNLGNVYATTRRFDKAEKYYLKAIQLDSVYVNPYYNLGNVYKDTRRYDLAEKYYKLSLQIDPTFHKVYNGMGLMFLYNNRIEDAKELFLKLLELDPNDKWGDYNMACLYSLQNEGELALDWLERSLPKKIPYNHIMRDSDLKNIRELDGFRILMEKHFPDQYKN